MADLSGLSGNEFVFTKGYFSSSDVTLKKGDYLQGTDEEKAKVVAATVGLQQFLQEQGLYKKDIDGQFGGGTEAAVKAFQKKHDLDPTGVVDERTFAAIETERARPDLEKQREEVAKHHEEMAHLEPATGDLRNKIDAKLEQYRSGVIMLVEREVNEHNGAVIKPIEGFGDVLHNMGVWSETITYAVPEDQKKTLLNGGMIRAGDDLIALDERTMRDPEALKAEMDKLAKYISGGQEAEHDFGKSAEILAVVSDRDAKKIRG